MRNPAGPHPHRTVSGRVGPAMLVAGALTLSVSVFVGYTLPKFIKKPPADTADAGTGNTPDNPGTPTPEAGAPGETPAAPTPAGTGEPTRPGRPPLATITPPPLTPAREAVATVADLVQTLRDGPAEKGLPALADPGGTTAASDLALLQQIVRDAGFDLDPDHPPREVGEIDGRSRWEFPLATAPGADTPAISRITVDLVKGEDGRWRIASIAFPDALVEHVASLDEGGPGATVAAAGPGGTDHPDKPTTPGAPGAAPGGTPAAAPLDLTGRFDPDKPTTTTFDDPLALADAFVQALASGDFAAARALADPELLSDEKLAALFIVAEDGGFSPRDRRPVITVTHDGDSALLIVRLASEGSPDGGPVAGGGTLTTEFGLELGKTPDGRWQVDAVNFSKLIADAATSMGAGDVAYAPIVTDPGGGESLALYFPFDQAGIHPRAARQLDIVAAVLRADPSKRVKIDGHTDARGTNRYNRSLSRERAVNTRAALLSLGVPNDQIVLRAYGEAKPAAPNTLPDGSDNPPGRARNRRAEVYLDF